MWNCQINTFTMKELHRCKCFRSFNIILFKKKLLQPVLCNKQAPLKEQGYNGFPEMNVPFKFSRINHRPLVIMDGCNNCCEIKTVSVTYWSLEVLPWNNDTTRGKIDGWNWCHRITLPSIYTCLKPRSYDISFLQFLVCKNTVNLKERVAAIALL